MNNELLTVIRNWLITEKHVKYVFPKEKMILYKTYMTYIKPDIIAISNDELLYAIEFETLTSKGSFMKKIRYGLGHAIINKIFFNYIYLAYPQERYKKEIYEREYFKEDFKWILKKEGIGLLTVSKAGGVNEVIKANKNKPIYKYILIGKRKITGIDFERLKE